MSEQFKSKCGKENPDDPRLNREVIPIVFETYGAAGPTTLEHMSLTRHQYGNVVLPCGVYVQYSIAEQHGTGVGTRVYLRVEEAGK